MPIFEYRCRDCGQISEMLLATTAGQDQIVCPGCGSPDLEKMLSAPGRIRMGEAPSGGMRCGRDATCCGRSEPCASPPCKK